MLYLTKVQLQSELNRCLSCKNQPCMRACPVNCNPQEFIRYAREGEWEQAVYSIMRKNPMGQTCGLICPDKFCMKSCTRGCVDFPINIPKIQATILDLYRNQKESDGLEPLNGRCVAVVGAGPSGMASAMVLGKAGFFVEIFEARSEIGGALNMIPEARLPHDVIEKDWAYIFDPERMKLHLNCQMEHPETLIDQYDGVIVATGEPHCMSLRIPGEELSVSYMDYLYHPEQYATNGSVAVIGGGNVAVDCAVTAVCQGASSVEMFIRRRVSDMRISAAEHLELLAHGINPNGMMSPEKIEKSGDCLTLWVHRNVFDGERWHPLEDSSIALPYFSLVIRAIGSRADEKLEEDPRVVYAGDCKTGGSTLVESIASGKSAAESLIATLLH